MNISSTKYNIPLSSLFSMAARENTKREFLFVSKVLGKHIPIKPNLLKIIGGILARAWLEESEGVNSPECKLLVEALEELQSEHQTNNSLLPALNILDSLILLKEKTLVIGFAETATGIAQAVFNNFKNAAYIHTTREVLTGIEPNFVFSEDHSHAMEHCIYSIDKDFLSGFDRIVLIDDELTTGNTALNLMKALPGKAFGIITILDWRSEEQVNKFLNQDREEIKVCSLVKGTLQCIKEGALDRSDNPVQIVHGNSIKHKDIILKSNNLIQGYSTLNGRFGINSNLNLSIMAEVKKAGATLSNMRSTGNCLCLGSEEFIYIPCMISAELGENVFFHSTTRSPILSKNIENYCIKNKVKFPKPQSETVMNYLYNIPMNFYNQVFYFTEKPLTSKDKDVFKNIFLTFGIPNIVFVAWN